MSKDLIKQFQRHLLANGYKLPKFGADGDFGQETYQAAMKALDDLAGHRKNPKPALVIQALPPEWLPRVTMNKIIIHWVHWLLTIPETSMIAAGTFTFQKAVIYDDAHVDKLPLVFLDFPEEYVVSAGDSVEFTSPGNRLITIGQGTLT